MTFPAGLLDAFETARHSTFRLETLPFYAGDPNFDRWLVGEPWQDTESKAHWCDLVRRRTAGGVAMQRVHLVTEPLSDYLRFELEWSYPPNVKAGEDVRVLVADYWGATDFWLFDDRELWVMHYDVDGQMATPSRASTAAALGKARHWRGAALEQSVPLAEYLTPA